MIRYVLQTREMNQLMGRLHRLFDIRITFFDMRQHEIKALDVKPMSSFCASLRRSKERESQCIQCDTVHLLKAKQQRDVHIYYCHCGLIEGIIPLYDRRDIYLGAIVFGQLRNPRHRASQTWSTAMVRRYRQLPTCTMNRARDIGYLLKDLSEYIIARELVRYRNKPWADELETFIDEHLREKLTLERLAEQIDKSASFVAQHFPSEFGTTPRQYILKRRMETACTLLEQGTSVKQAARRLGFYDAFHFSKTFKRYWNTTPTEYKQGKSDGA